jgi:hypothetical protein
LLLQGCAAYTVLAHPELVHAVPNVDVSTLDPGHVLPNMLPPNTRGVWYPIC